MNRPQRAFFTVLVLSTLCAGLKGQTLAGDSVPDGEWTFAAERITKVNEVNKAWLLGQKRQQYAQLIGEGKATQAQMNEVLGFVASMKDHTASFTVRISSDADHFVAISVGEHENQGWILDRTQLVRLGVSGEATLVSSDFNLYSETSGRLPLLPMRILNRAFIRNYKAVGGAKGTGSVPEVFRGGTLSSVDYSKANLSFDRSGRVGVIDTIGRGDQVVEQWSYSYGLGSDGAIPSAIVLKRYLPVAGDWQAHGGYMAEQVTFRRIANPAGLGIGNLSKTELTRLVVPELELTSPKAPVSNAEGCLLNPKIAHQPERGYGYLFPALLSIISVCGIIWVNRTFKRTK